MAFKSNKSSGYQQTSKGLLKLGDSISQISELDDISSDTFSNDDSESIINLD